MSEHIVKDGLFFCEHYKCYLPEKACIKRQALVEQDTKGVGARATFLGCINCPQGKEIRLNITNKGKETKMVTNKEYVKKEKKDEEPHRHAGNCKDCRWFVPFPIANGKIGSCRRRAPSSSGFPTVSAREWCGDFELRDK